MSQVKRIPKYLVIKQDIIEKLRVSDHTANHVLPTRSSLAVHYNTTVATVDRAFRELVNEGYVESRSGRRTVIAENSVRKSNSITVLMNWPPEQKDISADFLEPLFRGVRMACHEHKLEVHYEFLEGAYPEIGELTADSGILVIRPNYSEIPYLERLTKQGIQVVSVPAILDDERIPSISSDNLQGMELAVDHLVSLGHREIGFVTLSATVPDHFERLQGFLQSMERHGLLVNPKWMLIQHDNRFERYVEHLSDWITAEDHPTAIIAGDFLMTLAVIRRLNSLHLQIPCDISVVCYDDPPAAAHIDPPLTVVRQEISELGYCAVECLLEVMDGNTAPTNVRIPTTLIIRESTSSPSRWMEKGLCQDV
jgi:DNA-binding LacI/PurR family transcriptional regulator